MADMIISSTFSGKFHAKQILTGSCTGASSLHFSNMPLKGFWLILAAFICVFDLLICAECLVFLHLLGIKIKGPKYELLQQTCIFSHIRIC